MKLSISFSDLSKLIQDRLNARTPSGQDLGHLLNTIQLLPQEYAKEAIPFLVKCLNSPALGHRQSAANLLYELGVREGLQHLVFNALRVHPILNDPQFKISGWSDLLLIRAAEDIDEHLLTKLVSDDLTYRFPLHADLYSLANRDIVIKLIEPFFDHPAPFPEAAAYIHARHGSETGREILEKNSRHPQWDFFSIAGLSSFKDERSKNHFAYLLSLRQDLDSENTVASNMSREHLLLRYEMQCDKDISSKVKTFEKWFSLGKTNQGRKDTYPDSFSSLYCDDRSVPISAKDFLSEYADEEMRRLLKTKQQEALRKIDDMAQFSDYMIFHASVMAWTNKLPPMRDAQRSHESLVRGVLAEIELDDVVFVATDWLEKPEKYRIGTLDRFISNFRQN